VSNSIIFILDCQLGFRPENTADILGTVTDAGGAVVPGVKDHCTEIQQRTKQNRNNQCYGDYIFNLMPSASTDHRGITSFKKSTVSLAVVSGDRARANVQLQVRRM